MFLIVLLRLKDALAGSTILQSRGSSLTAGEPVLYPTIVDDMEALVVVTQHSLTEIYPAINATKNSELKLNLNTLIDTTEKLSDIELLEGYEMHPASLVRLLLTRAAGCGMP